MDVSQCQFFSVPRDVQAVLNASGIPRAVTIFYRDGDWWCELKTGEAPDADQTKRDAIFHQWQSVDRHTDPTLGPFDFRPVDVQIEFDNHGTSLRYAITAVSGRTLETLLHGTHSPIAAIKLTSYASRDATRIPDGATHYCWLSGVKTRESDVVDVAGNDAAMLVRGALAYLSREQSGVYRVIQINRLQYSDNGRVEYNGPHRWQSEYTQCLADHKRFIRTVKMPSFKDDPRHFAFISADEELTSSIDPARKWTPTQNGGFVHLFNDDKSPNDWDCFYELSPDVLSTTVSDES